MSNGHRVHGDGESAGLSQLIGRRIESRDPRPSSPSARTVPSQPANDMSASREYVHAFMRL